MARTSLTPLTALGAYGTYSANAADVTMTAADVANKNQATMSAKLLLIAHNTGGSAYTVTVDSVADPYGREGDITTYSVGAGEYAVFGPFEPAGWRQSDGKLYFEASNAAVKFGLVRLE